jgi:hypothetical protein
MMKIKRGFNRFSFIFPIRKGRSDCRMKIPRDLSGQDLIRLLNLMATLLQDNLEATFV